MRQELGISLLCGCFVLCFCTWAILYLAETLIKIQYRAQQSQPLVRCQNQEQTNMILS